MQKPHAVAKSTTVPGSQPKCVASSATDTVSTLGTGRMYPTLPLTLRPLNRSTAEPYLEAAKRRGFHVEPSREGVTVFAGDTFVCGVSIHSTEGPFLLVEDLVGDVPTNHYGRRILHSAVQTCLEAVVDYAIGRCKMPLAVLPMNRPALLRMAQKAGFNIRQGIPMFALPQKTLTPPEKKPKPKKRKAKKR